MGTSILNSNKIVLGFRSGVFMCVCVYTNGFFKSQLDVILFLLNVP